MKRLLRQLFLVSVFSVAMAALEAIVVVYLREIYYPDGFEFPLSYILPKIFLIEILREAATLVMLVCIGVMMGRSRLEKFAWFLLSFAIWDIFYYIWLKILLDWPGTLLTWDILFLIPVTWVGPVLAPVICSLTMILMGLLIIKAENLNKKVNFRISDWLLIMSGAILIFISFISDYTSIIISEGRKYGFSALDQNEHFIDAVTSYVPQSYNWFLFIIGELLILSGIALFYRRNIKKSEKLLVLQKTKIMRSIKRWKIKM